MHELLLVLGIHLLAVMSPGPDTAVVMQQSMSRSRAYGLYTALGIALGILVHVSYSLVGIGTLIAQSPVLFALIQSAGALYLVYMGVRIVLARGSAVAAQEVRVRHGGTYAGAVWKGFLTNVLNPKATLFFLALFSQVIAPTTSIEMQVLYGALMALDTFFWFALVAVFLNVAAVRSRCNRIIVPVEKCFGVLIAGLGVKILTTVR